MSTNYATQKGEISVWVTRIVAAVLFGVIGWSTVVAGHETGATTGTHEPSIPFMAVIGVSVGVSLLIGAVAVVRWQQYSGRQSHPRSHWAVPVLLLVLGVVALLAAVTQHWPLAVGGGLVGGMVAWVGRDHAMSPNDGCADAALGAVVAHRTVEGAVVASIYAASAALGIVGLAVLTLHAGAETAAVGGLYAPLGRRWAAATVVAVQLAFVGGALAGGLLAGLLATVSVPLLAAVGGVLLVAGGTEFRTVGTHQQKHPSL